MSPIRKAVIPAAGLGTRFLPATKAIPKEMLPIVNRPAIQLIVEEAAASGIEQVILITGRGKTEMVDHFDAHPQLEAALRRDGKHALLREVVHSSNLVKVHSVRQQRPLGLGHAILCARELVGDEPFVVFLPDDLVDSEPPCAKQLIDLYQESGKSVVALMNVPRANTRMFGIADGTLRPGQERVLEIDSLVEKPLPEEAPSTLGIVGRYVLDPHIFDCLDRVKPGAGDEIQLTDGLALLARERGLLGCLFEGERFDTGDVAGYLAANLNWARKMPDVWREVTRYLRTNGLP